MQISIFKLVFYLTYWRGKFAENVPVQMIWKDLIESSKILWVKNITAEFRFWAYTPMYVLQEGSTQVILIF